MVGASLELKPHRIVGIEGELRQGTFEVYENRTAKGGRRIGLKILVLPALAAKKAPDPLFILAGGPGQAATDNAKFNARVFAEVRRTRDIVMVDQRGTGESNGLKCALYGPTLQSYLGDLIPVETLRSCVEGWKRHADLRFYTTDIAMADLDEVRAAMDYERINLFGTSYGTRAAQAYMRQFHNRVRSAIMKGVTPITAPLTLPMARDAQRALDLTFDDCLADEACGTAFPKVKEEWRSVFTRLDKGEIEIELPTSADAKSERVKISRATLGPTVRTMLQSLGEAARLPLLIHQTATGDMVPFAQETLTIRRGFPKAVSTGMFLAITNAEDIPISDAKQVANESAGTFLRDDYFRQLQRAAELFPKTELPANYHDAVRSDIPVLLISGYLDPATPPSAAEEVGKNLRNSLQVVVRYGSHSYSGLSPCVDKLMADFISRASVNGLDVSCVDQIKRPAFAIDLKKAAEAE
jgi:pimeloyl-ACP methyl ester carboxylesterase